MSASRYRSCIGNGRPFERREELVIAPPGSTARDGPFFATREEAGRSLAAVLPSRLPSRGALLLAISQRALPVARIVARLLDAPLDLALVRRLRLAGGTAVGAVARGVMLINEGLIGRMRLEREVVEALASQASRELAREEADLRGGRPSENVVGKTAILVDDGLGDPGEWVAAARALRRQGAARVWLAAPALADSARFLVSGAMEEVVTVRPAPADGVWYGADGPPAASNRAPDSASATAS